MSRWLSPQTERDFTERVERILKGEQVEINLVLSYAPALRWVITYLARRNVPFRLVSLGAGVRRITAGTGEPCTCPRCGGTGKV